MESRVGLAATRLSHTSESMKRLQTFFQILGLLVFLQVISSSGVAAASPFLTHEAYVWQRAWNAPVREAVEAHGAAFSSLVVLGAQITWRGADVNLVRVPVDFALLGETGTRIGVAIRVGSFPWGRGLEEPVGVIAELAQLLVKEAASHGVAVAEVQIDFDSAESRLVDYAGWMSLLRERIDVPLTITALPTWLGRPGFEKLIRASDGYVLQVHSFEIPTGFDAPFTLCDPAKAIAAVERAGRFGVRFRVALPTYGYSLGFDGDDRFVGLSAEGPAPRWNAGTRRREVRTDPAAMADLVAHWTDERPAAMAGILWYRLPTTADRLNWRWPTLAAVMDGEVPAGRLAVKELWAETGLLDVAVENEGTADVLVTSSLSLRWAEGDLLVADALGGFTLRQGSKEVDFMPPSQPIRLRPGERVAVGWLRFSEAEIDVYSEFLTTN